MNKGASFSTDESPEKGPVFVSYATSDRKRALAVCESIERRGTRCWIACRDVEPGENYQEAIVRQIRMARAMVLVFSDAANNSDEIKKELSLASRYRAPVFAVRIEDVEPSDAFAYELSTRQWIDAFVGWDKSIDALVRKISQISNVASDRPQPDQRGVRTTSLRLSKAMIAAVALIALMSLATIWIFVRPKATGAHSMIVRLAGFEAPSRDVPAGLPKALADEIAAAFTEDGAVVVSTAAGPPAGSAPAYALSGTVRLDGDRIRIIAKLANERSGTTLWTNGFHYASSETARIPRWVAVDVGNLVRCGLFGASTYSGTLPDQVLSDYLQSCQNSSFDYQPTRALDFARKVVAAAPDFSWGWSAVALTALTSSYNDLTGLQSAALRKEALKAAARAISLDDSNSEAFMAQSYLADANDLAAREALLWKALAARPLACGCEHHSYGDLLQEVGRNREAIQEYRRSTEVVPLVWDSQMALGIALLVDGKAKEATKHFDAAADLSTSAESRNNIVRVRATVAQENYEAALRSLDDPASSLTVQTTGAYRDGFRALMTGKPQDRASAIRALTSLSADNMGRTGILVLGALGANAEALKRIEEGVRSGKSGFRAFFFYPSLAGARSDPAAATLVQRLHLVRYWKATHTKPDVCTEKGAPAFCKLI